MTILSTIMQQSSSGEPSRLISFLPIIVLLIIGFLIWKVIPKQVKAILPSIFAVIGLVIGLLFSYLIRPYKFLGFAEWFDMNRSDSASTILVSAAIGFIVGWLIDVFYEQLFYKQETEVVGESKVNPQGTLDPMSKEHLESSANIPQQIEELAKLKEKGILTEEEFQAKKHELLSKI